MVDAALPAEEAPKTRSKLPLIIGLVLMLALGGGGFYAVYSGLILAPHDPSESAPEDEHAAPTAPDVTFVALDPMIISLGTNGARHLRFSAQIEAPKAYASEVEHLKPRIMDVLNGYLRAVEVRDLEDPTALMRLRAQMLRRVQVVTGDGRINDLLIIEFVLN